MAITSNSKLHQWYRLLYMGQEYQVHSHYVVETDTFPGNVVDSLEAYNDYFKDCTTASNVGTDLLACLPQNVQLVDTNIQVIYPNRSLYVRDTISLAGGIAGDAETGNIASVITMRTDNGGRNQLSNRHIGPVAQMSMQDGAPSAGLRLLLALLAADMGVQLSLNGASQIISPIVNHPGAGFDRITNFIISDRLGTMRRRTLRVGI